MTLPKIDLPTYEVLLPCSEKTIKFRPFLVKEQKILLMAMESKSEEDIIRAIKQIVSNCIIEKDFDVENMSSIDLEYFFVHLRARSIGEKIHREYTCKNVVEGQECNHIMSFDYDILSIQLEKKQNHDKTIFFSKDVGVVMKYPSMKMAENLVLMTKAKSKTISNADLALDVIIECIDYIFDKENIFYIKEMDKKEVKEYIETIPKSSFDKIEQFFETMPELTSTIEHKCEKCGFEHKIAMTGMINFFE